MTDDSYVASIEAWRRRMDERLREPYGWLAVGGLFWLRPGTNRVGSDPEAEVRLPAHASSPSLGVIDVDGPRAMLHATGADPVQVEGSPVVDIELLPDVDPSPTFVNVGEVRLVLIRRGDRLGVRMWDPRRPERTSFPGRQWYPVDPAWRLAASFHPHTPPVSVRVPSILGEVNVEPSVGRVSFQIAGETYALEALPEESGELFLIFADPTNRDVTYPSGRFLYTDPPEAGQVVVDFNRAYSPPCAYTIYATCPLPPAENRLPVPVPAGEIYPRSPVPHSEAR